MMPQARSYLLCGASALFATYAMAGPLPYKNTYGIYITAPGQVTVSLKKTHYNTKVGLALENNLNNAFYVAANSSKTFNVVQPQILELEVLNVPDNEQLWELGDLQSGTGEKSYSKWPNFSISSQKFGKQISTWDFGDGGLVTITTNIITPGELAKQANARVYGENAVKNVLAQRTAITSGPPTLTCPPDEGPYHGPFDRGRCATMYCGNSPESWVRGNASFDRRSGQVTMLMELETDSNAAGPKGKIHVDVLDENGGILATVDFQEAGIGGKGPGSGFHARINDFAGYQNVPMGVPAKAASIAVRAECTGSVDQIWGIDFAQLVKAASLVVTALGGGSGQTQPNPAPGGNP